jgi:hypothetical protein
MRIPLLAVPLLLLTGCGPAPAAHAPSSDKPTMSSLEACQRLYGKDGKESQLSAMNDRLTDVDTDADVDAAVKDLVKFGASAPKPLDRQIADQVAGIRSAFGTKHGDIDAAMDPMWALFHTCNPLLVEARKKSERASKPPVSDVP